MNNSTTYSIVVPVYRSAEILPDLVAQLAQVLPTLNVRYEVILVNDGSPDSSWEVICQLAQEYPWLRGIRLMRNFGQHNALLCGIRAASNEVIVTMDDDLQHPPQEIPKLLAKLDQGYDVVYGVPRKLPHSLWRNLFSKYTKRAMSMAMGIGNVRDISAFRAFRTHLRQAFAHYQSPRLLLDVLLSWGTTRFTAVQVDHKPREVGQSNYNFFKLFNQAMLMLTGFSTEPLRLASIIGFVFTIFGFVVLIYVIGRYLVEGGSVPGFPFLASVVTIFSGAQLFALGLIGEYLARIFNRSMERPTYVVGNTTGKSGEMDHE
jgi:undecaprenyl-phosphate 4-deoxy-4-formamido-L-arabinose transferase